MRIAVVGASGTAGRRLVAEAVARGHDVVGIARRPSALPSVVRAVPADVRTGRGLADALEGVDVTVDACDVASNRGDAARDFFVSATARLQEVGASAGVRHHVVLSVVGVDVVPRGYYRAKLAQEEAALAGPVPATVVRSTQFHEFAVRYVRRARRAGVAAVPHMRMAPVATSEAAAHLLDVAQAPPAGRGPDIGGPEEAMLADLARRWARAHGSRLLVVPLRVPGPAGRALAAGGLVPTDGVRGRIRFDDWLAATSR